MLNTQIKKEADAISECITKYIDGLKGISGISDKELVLSAIYKAFMNELGLEEDYNSQETPMRVAKMFLDKTRSLREEPPDVKVFPNEKNYDEYIVVKNIPYFSLCSHHHVPFSGKVDICYHPAKKIAGLSKFARVVQYFANKPQIQEEMTAEIADYLWGMLEPKGLIVKIEGEHLCMTSRGAKAVGAKAVTQKMLGVIDKHEVDDLFKN